MLHIFGKVFDQLFPKAAAVRTVDGLPDDALDGLYEPRLFARTHYLLSYSDDGVRAVIRACKFYQHEGAARRLACQLDRWLSEQAREYLVVPVPLAGKRERERGHNQVTSVLAHSLELFARHRLDTMLLMRTRDTRPQSRLTRSERLQNLTGAFAARDGGQLTDCHLLLVDDVTTTGTTLNAAEAALRPLRPASITRLAFAH